MKRELKELLQSDIDNNELSIAGLIPMKRELKAIAYVDIHSDSVRLQGSSR